MTASHASVRSAAHGVEDGGIHGHDLALGSGSVDGLVGSDVYASWNRLFGTASIQYAIRGEGDFGYRFANELVWSGGPGVLLVRTPMYAVGLQAFLSGLTKGNDEQDGQSVGDTAFTGLYMGPRAVFTWGRSLAADVSGELPLVQHNTGLQIVPDYTIRATLSWRF